MPQLDRRRFLTLLAAGAAGALTGCTSFAAHLPGSAQGSGSAGTATPSTPVPSPHPGRSQVFHRLPADAGRSIALTIDDGDDAETVAAYVRFATDSGLAIMFNPNGIYSTIWEPHVTALAPLIAAGQVQIGNHTFSHPDVRRLSRGRITAELERNEQWIEKTFGITSRPWFRPPFGYHDPDVDAVAADAGFTHVAMWNGTLGDSSLLTAEQLMANAEKYIGPRVILLGHANHPTVTHLYDRIVELIRSRELTAVTLDQAFGTSRASG